MSKRRGVVQVMVGAPLLGIGIWGAVKHFLMTLDRNFLFDVLPVWEVMWAFVGIAGLGFALALSGTICLLRQKQAAIGGSGVV